MAASTPTSLHDNWGQPDAHERALVTTATLVGSVVMARAIDEAPMSESVLRAARAHLGAARSLDADAVWRRPLNDKEKEP